MSARGDAAEYDDGRDDDADDLACGRAAPAERLCFLASAQ
jgi:hypothetical protein